MTAAGEVALEQLVERTVGLKQELMAFLHDRRISRELDALLERRYGSVVTGDDDELALVFDRFILEHRLTDGRTVVERFVRARGDLPRVDRQMLLSWSRSVVESVFEVDGLDGNALRVKNLVDELPYRVWSNMGLEGFARLTPGTVAGLRLVPVLDEWMITGPGLALPPAEAEPLLSVGARQAAAHQESTCRNPAHRERAWQIVREHRERFVAHFGADQVVLPGAQVVDRMARFWAEGGGRGGARVELPPALAAADTVGVIYDEVEGLGFFQEFGALLAAFEHAAAGAAGAAGGDVVRAYLEDGSTSPMPLLRCVAAYPQGADAAFARALRRPRFSWARDGQALLRRYKAPFLDRVPEPGISIISDRLKPYVQPAPEPDGGGGRR
jgi:hypothetical protein